MWQDTTFSGSRVVFPESVTPSMLAYLLFRAMFLTTEFLCVKQALGGSQGHQHHSLALCDFGQLGI